jgi:hypothetical protein
MDTTTAIIVATIAFVGVLVGGLITAGTNYLLAVRKEKADARKDRNSEAAEVAAAARIIHLELIAYSSSCRVALDRKGEPPDIEPLTLLNWEKYSHLLAGALTFDAWVAISHAFLSATVYQKIFDPDSETLQGMVDDVVQAADALTPYLIDPYSPAFPELHV